MHSFEFLPLKLDLNFGNSTISLPSVTSVTFDVGVTEVCFKFRFSNETVDTKSFKLTIMSDTNGTEVEIGSESVIISIIGKDSRELF